jgi:chaperonin GroEL (HSP60 family)
VHADILTAHAYVRSTSDPVTLRVELMKIAKTVLSSKILGQHSDLFASLAVNAVVRLKVVWPKFSE